MQFLGIVGRLGVIMQEQEIEQNVTHLHSCRWVTLWAQTFVLSRLKTGFSF